MTLHPDRPQRNPHRTSAMFLLAAVTVAAAIIIPAVIAAASSTRSAYSGSIYARRNTPSA